MTFPDMKRRTVRMEKLTNIAVYKDNNDVIIVFKNSTANIENIISKVLTSIADVEEKEINHLSETPEDETLPELPSFMQEEKTSLVSSIGDYQITGIKKYAKSGKTLTEISETDNQWLLWISKNYKPTTPQGEKDLAAINKFLSNE
jgi:hypothetical protein